MNHHNHPVSSIQNQESSYLRAYKVALQLSNTAGNFKFEISNLKLYMPLSPIHDSIYDIRYTIYERQIYLPIRQLDFAGHWEPPF